MVDWGGLSTKELSADEKGGILDTTLQRVTPMSPANPLATIADVLAGAAASIFTKKAILSKVDGSFESGDTANAFVDFAGVKDLAFTVVEPSSDAMIIISGTGGASLSNPANVAVNIGREPPGGGGFTDIVTGTEGAGLGAFSLLLSGLSNQFHQGGGINAGGGPMTAIVFLSGLVVGTHTLRLRLFVDSGAFPVGQKGRIYATAAVPFRLMVLHK